MMDVSTIRSKGVAGRCLRFLEKVTIDGFDPSTSKAVLPSMDDISSKKASPKVSRNRPATRRKQPPPQRELMVYDDSDVFSGVTYEYKEWSDTKRIKSMAAELTSESAEELEPGEIVEDPIDMSTFSFEYDPIKDAHLLAKNCEQQIVNDPEMRKYWSQRYRLFFKLNKGILMDREGWFSVTPQVVAEHIARVMVTHHDAVIVDAFCGVGGNAIQLAYHGARVIAIDLDPVRLKCAIQNAKVYGVRDRIEFICGDFFHFASRWMGDEKNRQQPIDGVFLSPPWGGPRYLGLKEFDLATDMTPSGVDIFNASKAMSPNIAYFLPRNTKFSQMKDLGECRVESCYFMEKQIAVTAYYGVYSNVDDPMKKNKPNA